VTFFNLSVMDIERVTSLSATRLVAFILIDCCFSFFAAKSVRTRDKPSSSATLFLLSALAFLFFSSSPNLLFFGALSSQFLALSSFSFHLFFS
jgi:hypothetical protein